MPRTGMFLSNPHSASRLSLLLSLFFSVTSSMQGAEPHRFTLTSVDRNLQVATFDLQGSAVTPQVPGWRVTRRPLAGGKQDGCELLVLDNGRLKITVIPTRGMGILNVQAGDVRLGWSSPVKEIVNPRHINLDSRGGLGWLEGFNEWMVRCGLENNGHPGLDRFTNNVGEEASMQLSLHGKIANLPASEVEVLVDAEPPHRLRIRGTVWERSFYGPNLKLQTEVSTEPGSLEFRIEDTITNHGGQPQEFEILYHANFGRPLLEEGSEFLGAAKRVVPFNAHAANSVQDYARFKGPQAGFTEEVYCLFPKGDAQGRTTIALRNRAGDRGAALSFSLKELPYVTLWKNTAAEADGYVTGLEPGTNFPNNRRIERKLGRVPRLAPGAVQHALIDIQILPDAAAVRQVAAQIEKLQGATPAKLEPQPEQKE